jgi:hypothetical protein
MSFMVALILSRSRRSFSSSVVSNFRAPVTELAPGFKVRGRKLGSGFFSVLLNMEKPFQSNDKDRREALVEGLGVPSFGTLKLAEDSLPEADMERPTMTDWGRGLAVLGAAVDGVAGSLS